MRITLFVLAFLAYFSSAMAVVELDGDSNGATDVTKGGTNALTLTDGGVLLGSGTAAITPMAVLADGEMIVGDGTTDPVAESGATLRTSIGLGSAATRDAEDTLTDGANLPDGAAVKAYGDANWATSSGDVVGPASSTDTSLAIFDDTTGKLITEATNCLYAAGVLTCSDIVITNSADLPSTVAIPSLTPVTDDCDNFLANFTGNNLKGGTFICNVAGTCQLPVMAAGYNFSIITEGAIECIIDTNAVDGYLHNGVTGAEGANITNLSTAGNMAVLQYYTVDDWLINTDGWTAE